MKIGILTYHCVPNYGANLQAYSTVSFLRSQGIDVEVINWYPSDLETLYRRMVDCGQINKHQDFVGKHLPLSKRLYTNDEVEKYVDECNFDAIFIGSDAVFSYFPLRKRLYLSKKTIFKYVKPSSDHCYPNPFWGIFNIRRSNCKLISLSASAQYLDYSICLPHERRYLSTALKRFDVLTVRDRWTKDAIKSITGHDTAIITPDPVFGLIDNCPDLKSDDVIKKYNLPSRYVIFSFCNMLYDFKWFDHVKNALNLIGYQIVNLPMPEGRIEIPCDISISNPLDVQDWYNIIRLSSGYIGQRMHPMIVALINYLPIVIFDHYSYKEGVDGQKTSKIFDLLERGGLTEYYINTRFRSAPSPDDIITKFTTFNKQIERQFVSDYAQYYFQFMSQLITSI